MQKQHLLATNDQALKDGQEGLLWQVAAVQVPDGHAISQPRSGELRLPPESRKSDALHNDHVNIGSYENTIPNGVSSNHRWAKNNFGVVGQKSGEKAVLGRFSSIFLDFRGKIWKFAPAAL